MKVESKETLVILLVSAAADVFHPYLEKEDMPDWKRLEDLFTKYVDAYENRLNKYKSS